VTATFIDYQTEFVDQLNSTQRETEAENNQYTLGYTFASPDNPLIDFSSNVYRVETALEQVRIDSTSPFEPAGSERSFEVVTEGFDVYNTSRFGFHNTKLALTYGADGFQDEVATSDPVGNGDEFTPGGERTVYGTFVQGSLTFFEIVDLIGAVRYDAYEIEGGDTHLEGDRVSPKVTAAVTPLGGMTFFATYAEGYRAPAVTETLISATRSRRRSRSCRTPI
jgi:hemoglobin/transferrin/lactoferrin receptor protein